MSKNNLIFQGAEAKIILMGDKIVKDRIPKSYRIPELDNKIRTKRTKKEAKLLDKASSIIPAPKPLHLPDFGRMIHMPFIKGQKLSDNLDNFPIKKQKQICKQIGESIAKLHENNIIHGDLTTSNMILKQNKVYFIDFGLGYISSKYEDKAVDLHLLKQALEAKHYKRWEMLFEEVFKGYKISKDANIILERIKAIEKRGRYKH
jgi:Kae1-associated kinase Bud32